MTSLMLSRVQFAITITFHILFPAFSIGLATYAVILEGLWLGARKKVYYQSLRFWSKILALTFGMGIVSGLAMAFQMGMNWGGFSEMVGPVLGVLFSLETMTAFFVEATFLGIMLFAWRGIPRGLHFFATIMVFVGVTLSAFWIMAANSWMQTPAGAVFNHHQFVVQNWLHVVFNHSTLLRYAHMLLASYIATAMVIAGVAASIMLRKKFAAFARFNLKFNLLALALLLPLQIALGDAVGLEVHRYQPAKTAAIEAAWRTHPGTPLVIAALISQQQQKNIWAIEIPHLAALINTHKWNGTVRGLRSFPRWQQPEVWLTFYSFRIMVGCGLLILALALYGSIRYWRGNLIRAHRFLRSLTWLSPLGFIALITGWYTAETGRQPWVVYNIIRTSDAASTVQPHSVLIGFIVILLVYGFLFGICFMGYFLKSAKTGPIIKPRRRGASHDYTTFK